MNPPITEDLPTCANGGLGYAVGLPGVPPTCELCINEQGDLSSRHILHHVAKGYPTKLTANQINLLPMRKDIVDDFCGDMDSIPLAIAKNQFILFLPISHVECSEFVGRQQTYAIHLYGILPRGNKACVILRNIPYYVDIKVPGGLSPSEVILSQEITTSRTDEIGSFMSKIRGLVQTEGIDVVKGEDGIKIEHVRLYPFREFSLQPEDYIRVYCYGGNGKNSARGKLLSEVAKMKWETSSDDTDYYCKVAREYGFNTADWNTIRNYEVVGNRGTCQYTFAIDVCDISPLDPKTKETLSKKPNGQRLIKDHTLVCMWDIETYRQNQREGVPTPEDTDWRISVICCSFFWHWSTKPLLNIAIVDAPTSTVRRTAATDEFPMPVIIECGIGGNLSAAMGEVLARIQPDVMGAFNGANFDWPIVREDLFRRNSLVAFRDNVSCAKEWNNAVGSIYNWNFRGQPIKISAEVSHNLKCLARFPGMIDFDVMPSFMKAFPREEVGRGQSLNHYLKLCGLQSKEDMPYKRMFHIMERAIALDKPEILRTCHCQGDELIGFGCPPSCPVCDEWIADLDYEPDGYSATMDAVVYSNRKYSHKCCACDKRQRSMDDMADVVYYCMIDCIRPQQMCQKKSTILEWRGVANVSYTSTASAFTQADGAKVRNMMARECATRQIAFSFRNMKKSDSEKERYPGAKVFPPLRGLKLDIPVFALDFASLYPSLIRTYNISPEKTIRGYSAKTTEHIGTDCNRIADPNANPLAEKVAMHLTEMGYSLLYVPPFTCERGEKKGDVKNKYFEVEGWIVRHNLTPKTVGNVKSQRYRFIENPNKVAKTDETWITVPDGDALPGEETGVLPTLAGMLFDMRIPVKAAVGYYNKILDNMKKAGVKQLEVDGTVMTYTDVVFYRNSIDAKQNGIKRMNNTIYGKMGDFREWYFSVFVANAVTYMGKINITAMAKFVVEKFHCAVQYGDTDSLYLCADPAIYAKAQAIFDATLKTEADKLNFWTEMCTVTFGFAKMLGESIANLLMTDNGTRFLSMAFEEVAFPMLLTGKKKYCACKHLKVESINFDTTPKDGLPFTDQFLVKGLEIVKQGKSIVAINMGERYVRTVLSASNNRDEIAVITDLFREYHETEPNPDDYKITLRYKPNKKNVAVHTFRDRMVKKYEEVKDNPTLRVLFEPPEPGDKFDCITCEKPIEFTIKGSRIKTGKGDRLEYARVVKCGLFPDIKINKQEYMESSIIGIFARFIAYLPQFQPEVYDPEIETDKDKYKAMDMGCVKRAGEFLSELYSRISGRDTKAIIDFGRDCRKIYNRSEKYYRLVARVIFGDTVMINEDYDMSKHLQDGLAVRAEPEGRKLFARVMARLGTNPVIWQHWIGNTPKTGVISKLIDEKLEVLCDAIDAVDVIRKRYDYFVVSKIIEMRNGNIRESITDMEYKIKHGINLDDSPLTESEKIIVDEFNKKLNTLRCLYLYRSRTSVFLAEVNNYFAAKEPKNYGIVW
jgi:DNA polymerase elongation subunit (family B)